MRGGPFPREFCARAARTSILLCMCLRIGLRIILLIVALPVAAPAQTASSWHVMQDGVAFFTWNHQGGPRGGTDFGVLNWWMGMAERPAGGGRIRFNLMLSLDPASVGNDGYREIFQVGETLDGFPLIDRQHPHDFLMQGAVVWDGRSLEGTRCFSRVRPSVNRRWAPSRSCIARRLSRTRQRRSAITPSIRRTSRWA